MIRARTAAMAAALLASASSGLPVADAAEARVTQVKAADLGPTGPWFRLQDDPSNAGRPAGVQQVDGFADPVRFNGSLHLAIGPGQQAQAAHYFSAQVALSRFATGLSYDTFVDGAKSSARGTGPNFQLPMFCEGGFTTLSFQPQLATDALGHHGIHLDRWQHFVSTAASIWRSSRAVTGVPAGGEAPLSTFLHDCVRPGDGVIGIIANVGTLGDPTATLDTHVDNMTALGTVYDFTTGERVSGTASAIPTALAGGPAVYGTIAFTSPPGGPSLRDVGARLVLRGPAGLDPSDLSLMVNGHPVKLVAGRAARDRASACTLVAEFRTSHILRPGMPLVLHLRIKAGKHAPKGLVKITAELLADGYVPAQFTGITARTELRIVKPPRHENVCRLAEPGLCRHL